MTNCEDHAKLLRGVAVGMAVVLEEGPKGDRQLIAGFHHGKVFLMIWSKLEGDIWVMKQSIWLNPEAVSLLEGFVQRKRDELTDPGVVPTPSERLTPK
jgi:hypothetical protein